MLSVKLEDPQFSGQTKERLSSRECAVFVSGVVRDAFSLYLNSNTAIGDQLAEIAIAAAQRRLKSRKQVARKKLLKDQRYQASLQTVPVVMHLLVNCS